jgi:putative membrane protein
MSHPIVRWIVLTLAVFLAAKIVPGISYETYTSLLIAGLVLGILNTFVKPILTLLSLPFIIVTLGLFLVILNALTLKLTGWLVPGFHVNGFWAAVLGALIISVVNLFFGGTKSKAVKNSRFQVHSSTLPSNAVKKVDTGKGDVIDI